MLRCAHHWEFIPDLRSIKDKTMAICLTDLKTDEWNGGVR